MYNIEPEYIEITNYEVEVLNHLAHKIHAYNVWKGWWDDPRRFGETIALIHSELSEALEGDRKSKKDDHLPHRKNSEVEIADAFIREFDLCGREQWDIGGAIQEKFAYNKIRADHKKENRALENGKKY